LRCSKKHYRQEKSCLLDPEHFSANTMLFEKSFRASAAIILFEAVAALSSLSLRKADVG
jgi:hypothetical protein